jgi:hypothetical protein
MTDFIFAQANLPFTIALGLMIAIGLLEGITTLMGFGASSFVESFMPDADIDIDVDVDIDADIDMDADIDAGAGISHDGDMGDIASSHALSRLLGWFNIGRVPVLILFVMFLLGFGIIGLTIQSVVRDLAGQLLPMSIPSAGAFFGALVFVKFSGMILAKIIPKDETQAVSETTFIGRAAVITLGTAKRGQPAQAKFQDQYGQTHYIMVEPDAEADAFATGTEILIVTQNGAVFRAIRNPGGVLSEKKD